MGVFKANYTNTDSSLKTTLWTREMIDEVNHLIMEGWPPRRAQDTVLEAVSKVVLDV